mgnify:CR=1 FL=1
MTSQFELVISDQAKEDMLDIWQYIALDSIDNADQFIVARSALRWYWGVSCLPRLSLLAW